MTRSSTACQLVCSAANLQQAAAAVTTLNSLSVQLPARLHLKLHEMEADAKSIPSISATGPSFSSIFRCTIHLIQCRLNPRISSFQCNASTQAATGKLFEIIDSGQPWLKYYASLNGAMLWHPGFPCLNAHCAGIAG